MLSQNPVPCGFVRQVHPDLEIDPTIPHDRVVQTSHLVGRQHQHQSGNVSVFGHHFHEDGCRAVERPARSAGISTTTHRLPGRQQRIDFIEKQQCRGMRRCIRELSVNSFLCLAHPHAHHIAGKNSPKGQSKFAGSGLGEKCLAASWRAVKQDSISYHAVFIVFPGFHPALNQFANLPLLLVKSAHIRKP